MFGVPIFIWVLNTALLQTNHANLWLKKEITGGAQVVKMIKRKKEDNYAIFYKGISQLF